MKPGADVSIVRGEALELMRRIPSRCASAIVTDPPYGLGFMGKAWDRSVPPAELWREALRVCRPGAHLLAFCGTRTYHRLACAVEDAGWEIRDALVWLYGEGFPKGLNVSKALDRERSRAELSRELSAEEARFCEWFRSTGVARSEVLRLTGSDRFLTGVVEILNTATRERPRMARRAMVPTAAAWAKLRPLLGQVPEWVEALVKDPPKEPEFLRALHDQDDEHAEHEPETAEAEAWLGYGTALKPAAELIILARAPLEGSVADCARAHGAGALNIGECRVGTDGGTKKAKPAKRESVSAYGDGLNGGGVEPIGAGRWPANVVLDEQAAAMLDEQTGELTSGRLEPHHKKSGAGLGGSTTFAIRDRTGEPGSFGGDSGGASRFFYCAKASPADRTCGGAVENRHPTVKPLELMRWLVRLVTVPGERNLVLDLFAGSGTTALACDVEGVRCVAVEIDQASALTAAARLLALRRDRARSGVMFAGVGPSWGES